MSLSSKKVGRWLVCLSLILVVLLVAMVPGWCAKPKVIVVASTSWTGAIAEAAGADEVRVLAPFELKHPPEYDYRPSDLAKLINAALLVYAGYEGFIKKLVEASSIPESKIVKIMTVNDPANLKQQARLLAEKLGTEAQEKIWEEQFDRVTGEILKRAEQKNVSKTRALVQQHQVPFAKWLGYDIVGVFSANELSPAKVMEYANLKPDIIIDNIHNPQGKPIMEIIKCRYVELINFPSVKAPSLIELFKENAALLGL
ncbi:MAG TPA: zinc ABC transporter substrate-binding protein [Bacillota bacterium]|jgi:zinc transport system substrate-binding protein|nr:zinc ABC transporter substrate-binding protein [Bacillota bacterium]HOL09926.1 zinc ABC transporter substrate-binding protein [Bacillota bacterium]HPO96792.1 zinc ABC transporter substrate-binding protein [Bacillota bacterium]